MHNGKLRSRWGKFLTKHKIDLIIKLDRKFNSDLISLYGGLHPKHIYHTRHEWVGQFINKSDIVLDIACGNGCCAYNLADKCRNVIAVDFQKPLKQFLGKNNLTFYEGDILKIVPTLKEDYTFAVAFHILEHLDNPIEFLNIVKTDQIAVIVPHEENWFVNVKKDLGLNWMGDKTHKRLYNKKLLETHLNDAGFSRIELLEFDGDNGIRAVASRITKK